MPTLAKLTIAAFDEAVARDGGNVYRKNLQLVLPHIGDAYRQDDDGFRSHMGASIIGGECGRALWYDFHWTTKSKFSGRILRLFNRGHLEEGRIIALLLTAGVQIYQQDAEGKQFRVSSYGGHFGGSGDGIVVGIPDLPAGLPALLEIKTHSDKSFKLVKNDGVRSAKFEHYVQMQIYLRGMNLTVALYLAVNKNDDEIYAELVQLDNETADKFYQRAHTIIPLVEAPKRISNSPGWRACSWCDHKPTCHLRVPPEINCRTCESAVPRDDGTWWCDSKERQRKMIFGPETGISEPGETLELTKKRQLAGCKMYALHRAYKNP